MNARHRLVQQSQAAGAVLTVKRLPGRSEQSGDVAGDGRHRSTPNQRRGRRLNRRRRRSWRQGMQDQRSHSQQSDDEHKSHALQANP